MGTTPLPWLCCVGSNEMAYRHMFGVVMRLGMCVGGGQSCLLMALTHYLPSLTLTHYLPSLTHTLLTLSHTHITYPLSLTHYLPSLTITHSHTTYLPIHTLSHTHSLSLSHTHTHSLSLSLSHAPHCSDRGARCAPEADGDGHSRVRRPSQQ